MKAIGIDIGTTTISAAVTDADTGRLIESRTVENGCFIDTGRSQERIQDADALVRRARALLNGLLDRYPETGTIGLTGQMHGIVYTNRDGRAVSPLYTWQDPRAGLPPFNVVKLARQNGDTVTAAGYGLATHLSLIHEGQAPGDAVSLCTIPDYFGMALTGRKRPLMHAGMAASLGFYDAEAGTFRTGLMKRLEPGFDPAVLPEVTGEILPLGTFRGRKVTAALGDNQAGFLASVGLSPDTVLVNIGTGGQISVLSDRCFFAPGVEARPFLNGKYLLAGASLCGGRAYAILERFFRSFAAELGKDGSQYGLMERLARKPALPDPMRVITAFHGTRRDPLLRGSIQNLTEDNFTPEGLIRGVMQGMADELYELFRTIQDGTGVRAKALVGSGNGLRKNEPLQKVFEDTFGARLTLSSYQEEAACGAAQSSVWNSGWGEKCSASGSGEDGNNC